MENDVFSQLYSIYCHVISHLLLNGNQHVCKHMANIKTQAIRKQKCLLTNFENNSRLGFTNDLCLVTHKATICPRLPHGVFSECILYRDTKT